MLGAAFDALFSDLRTNVRPLGESGAAQASRHLGGSLRFVRSRVQDSLPSFGPAVRYETAPRFCRSFVFRSCDLTKPSASLRVMEGLVSVVSASFGTGVRPLGSS